MGTVFDYLEELNKSQREAVTGIDGPTLIVAGAGSGKTRVLTYRIAHLLNLGVKPSAILALTFTNKAAGEMKERIATLVGSSQSRYLWMGTFHSIFARILRIENEATGFNPDFTIYDAADSRNLIRVLIKEAGLDDKIYRPGTVAARISMAKNNLIFPTAYAFDERIRDYDKAIRMPRISALYKEYARRCRLSNAMDFDDLLVKTNLLLRDNQEILNHYQQKFEYLLVDEFQDTNFAQYQIINMLAAKHRNICVVGDDSQSIYAFRGARIENIFSFRRDYPDHKIFKLEQNYRSTQNIVNAANSVIAHNQKQITKTIFSEKETGAPVRIFSALTDQEEGFRVAAMIAEIQLRDHLRFSDFAILYRTNAQSRIFEETLRRINIPYKIYGGLSFFQRKEIKDLLAWFRLVVNPDDNEALKRIINYPPRGIGEITLSKLEKAASASETSIWEIITSHSDLNPASLNTGTLRKIAGFLELANQFRRNSTLVSAFELARNIATATGILKELHNDQTPEGISRYQNVEELLNAIQEFTISAREEERGETIGHYLQEVALMTDQDNEKEDDRNKVTLMTVHSAKGLEFNTVFIVGMEKNLFPSAPMGNPLTEEETEEERRLFYVALTRAMHRVSISWARQRYRWGKLDFCHPSPFLNEIDSSFTENADRDPFAEKRKLPGMVFPDRKGASGLPYIPKQSKDEILKPGVPHHSPTPRLKSSFDSKISRLRNENSEETGTSDLSGIVPGITVEHQRFGLGKVLRVEGSPPDLKATVFFHNAGQKQLLLRFARLKIIK